jgi:hypothetical protein
MRIVCRRFSHQSKRSRPFIPLLGGKLWWSAMIDVEQVRTRARLSEFIALPRRLYDGMAGFVAPLDHERRHLLDPKKSAFFTHGVASYWIARRNGKAVGRISAQIDSAATEPNAHEIGLFGCLDAVDDPEVVATLLRTAESWLRERKRRIVRGPFLLSINGESGLLVEGHRRAPMILMPWHPIYLGPHVEMAGYRTAAQLLGYILDMGEFQQSAFDSYVKAFERAHIRDRIAVRPLRLGALEEDMEIARRIFNDAWQKNWGFTPFTGSDMAEMFKQFRPLLNPKTAFFITVSDEPAAFCLMIPNLFEATAGLGPRPGPVGWMRLLYRLWKRQFHSHRIILLGMVSKYQRTAVGGLVNTAVFGELRKLPQVYPIESVAAGWILEQNWAARRPIEAIGFRPGAKYNIYEKALAP